VPPRIDEHHDASLPTACQAPVIETGVATQYQEELPVARVVVRAFQVHVGQRQGCGRRVQGRLPLQTSDALGAAAAQLGPQATALAAVLNKTARPVVREGRHAPAATVRPDGDA